MNTAPAEIASSMICDTVPTEVAIPDVAPRAPAVWRNTRYVGVLSRKEDSAPVAQNISHGWDKPNCAPCVFNRINAGIMVMKMPMNSLATSAMGAKVNSLSVRVDFLVVFMDSQAANRMMTTSTSVAYGKTTS